MTRLKLRPLPASRLASYREEVAARCEQGTYRMAMNATPQQIRESIEDVLAIIEDKNIEEDVREWKRGDLRGLERAYREKTAAKSRRQPRGLQAQ